MKIYNVYHEYDEDGGFGDAVSQKFLLESFESESDANEYVKEFENPHIYDRPYAALECGKLVVEAVDVIAKGEPYHKPENMWWE